MKLTIPNGWLSISRSRLQRGRGKLLLHILRLLVRVNTPCSIISLHYSACQKTFVLIPVELPKATYDDLMEQVSDLKDVA